MRDEQSLSANNKRIKTTEGEEPSQEKIVEPNSAESWVEKVGNDKESEGTETWSL